MAGLIVAVPDCLETSRPPSELHALGIDLFLHQQGLDTTTPSGKAMFQMGVFADFERAMIQERVRAGLRGVREQHVILRPAYAGRLRLTSSRSQLRPANAQIVLYLLQPQIELMAQCLNLTAERLNLYFIRDQLRQALIIENTSVDNPLTLGDSVS